MILKSKICGVTDTETLRYLVDHECPPQFVGFIVNYPKSKRFVDQKKLKELIKIDKKKSLYVAVLVNPDKNILKEIEDLPFDQKGTSHKQVINSRAFTRYHPHHNPAPYFTNPNEPHILITVSMDDILFLERTVTIRANNYNVDTNQNKIQVHDKFLDAFSWRQKFEY